MNHFISGEQVPSRLNHYYRGTNTLSSDYISMSMDFCCDITLLLTILWECSGSVVECLTRDRGAAGSSLTGVTALWSLSKTHLF